MLLTRIGLLAQLPLLLVLLAGWADVARGLLRDPLFLSVLLETSTGVCAIGLAMYAKSRAQSLLYGAWGLIPLAGPFLGVAALAAGDKVSSVVFPESWRKPLAHVLSWVSILVAISLLILLVLWGRLDY